MTERILSRDGSVWYWVDDASAAPADVGDLAAAYAALGSAGRITGWAELQVPVADELARSFLADFATSGEPDMTVFAGRWVPGW